MDLFKRLVQVQRSYSMFLFSKTIKLTKMFCTRIAIMLNFKRRKMDRLDVTKMHSSYTY